MPAIDLLAKGERDIGIRKRKQNHQAESSFTLLHPVFSYIFRVWFSTVRSEIKRWLATSFFEAPQARSSVMSRSRRVSLAFDFIRHSPNFENSIFVEYALDRINFRYLWLIDSIKTIPKSLKSFDVQCCHYFISGLFDIFHLKLSVSFLE